MRTPAGGAPHRSAAPLPGPAVWAAVAAGGGLGAVGRYLLTVRFPHPAAAVDWTVLAVNLSACLLLGILTGAWSRRPAPQWLRAGLGAGLLGGFSTFSALALSLDGLLAEARVAEAALYLGISVAGGLAAAAAGLVLGRRLARGGPANGTHPGAARDRPGPGPGAAA